MIKINHLDHVAITVKDLETSARWYEEVLGLKRVQPEAWQPYPIFMLAGTTGVAIFPASQQEPFEEGKNSRIKIDHFAFNVDLSNFQKAIARYESLGLEYAVKDHQYFHSVYTLDPDGHEVELTTLVVPKDKFFTTSENSTKI